MTEYKQKMSNHWCMKLILLALASGTIGFTLAMYLIAKGLLPS